MSRLYAWMCCSLLTVNVVFAAPDFARDVRPILSQHCFQCHGPDEKKIKGKLRLDSFEAATTSGRSGDLAITPGKPDASEVVRRIRSSDDTQVMPPPHVKKPLTDKQKAILSDWIAAGAKYESHWAFTKPRTMPSRGIDHAIREKLTAAKMQLSPPADKVTLIRRVTLDLIGLPPTPAEVDTFLADTTPNAYETLVDRLLASPHYGERWARKWLDLARYADTNGYEKDRPRTIWPYRDWVINALNADMPFDQFSIEQIAGDLLPNATPSQIVATGFHRNTMLNEEGGIDPLEFRYYAVVDRVNTTGIVWLGLTLGCAQCHTHKYDPIPHADYFRFFAFLNNAEEPDYEVLTPDLRKRQAEIDATIRTREAELLKNVPEDKFTIWLDQQRQQLVPWTIVRPTKTEAGLTKLKQLADGSLLASGDPTKADVYELTFDQWPNDVTAIRLEALPHDSLPARGPGRAYYEGPKGDFLLSDIRLSINNETTAFADASENYAKLGLIAGKSGAKLAFDDNLQTGWGASGREGSTSWAVFNLAKPSTAGAAKLTLRFERHYSASLGRFRLSVTTKTGEVKAGTIRPELESLVTKNEWSKSERELLLREFAEQSLDTLPQRTQIEDLRRKRPSGPRTLVMSSRPADHPRRTFIHNRGEFLQPTEEVAPGGLSVLHPLPKGTSLDRLTFAKWLMSPDNPLTARVTVNRAWAAFFGHGLVRTIDDFGYQGDMPTHPELLDELATGLRVDGWSMKRLHKRIVMSETYRQSSKVTDEHRARDPENKLLARFPRQRLEAEMVRDAVLRASGLLSEKLGGPSVYPPQPAGVTEVAYGKTAWTPSQGADRYRRGLYTYSKRTAPFAMTSTFDGPSGEACIAKREVSNTPLQALTMLNDLVLTDSAQALAREVAKLDAHDAIVAIYRRCLSRTPRAEETQLLIQFWQKQREKLATDPLAAMNLASQGDKETTVARAAWVAVARVVMNLDEFIVKE